MNDELAAAFRVLADAVADRVIERLRGGVSPSWTDQRASQLGVRRHCSAVRRRIANAEGGAAIVGRQFLLDPEALAQELTRGSKKPAVVAVQSDTPAAQLERRLGLVR